MSPHVAGMVGHVGTCVGRNHVGGNHVGGNHQPSKESVAKYAELGDNAEFDDVPMPCHFAQLQLPNTVPQADTKDMVGHMGMAGIRINAGTDSAGIDASVTFDGIDAREKPVVGINAIFEGVVPHLPGETGADVCGNKVIGIRKPSHIGLVPACGATLPAALTGLYVFTHFLHVYIYIYIYTHTHGLSACVRSDTSSSPHRFVCIYACL